VQNRLSQYKKPLLLDTTEAAKQGTSKQKKVQQWEKNKNSQRAELITNNPHNRTAKTAAWQNSRT